MENEKPTAVDMLDRISHIVTNGLKAKSEEVDRLSAKMAELKADPKHSRSEEYMTILELKASMAAGNAYNEVAEVFVEYVKSMEGKEDDGTQGNG